MANVNLIITIPEAKVDDACIGFNKIAAQTCRIEIMIDGVGDSDFHCHHSITLDKKGVSETNKQLGERILCTLGKAMIKAGQQAIRDEDYKDSIAAVVREIYNMPEDILE